jgi:hypothetical protein
MGVVIVGVLPLLALPSTDPLFRIVYTHKEQLYWHHVEKFLKDTLDSS